DPQQADPQPVDVHTNGLHQNGAATNGHRVGNGHTEVPEEFFQTLEISSIDLDAAWPAAEAGQPAGGRYAVRELPGPQPEHRSQPRPPAEPPYPSPRDTHLDPEPHAAHDPHHEQPHQQEQYEEQPPHPDHARHGDPIEYSGSEHPEHIGTVEQPMNPAPPPPSEPRHDHHAADVGNYDEETFTGTPHDGQPLDPHHESEATTEEREQLFQDTSAEEPRHPGGQSGEDLDYFGRPQATATDESRPAAIELPPPARAQANGATDGEVHRQAAAPNDARPPADTPAHHPPPQAARPVDQGRRRQQPRAGEPPVPPYPADYGEHRYFSEDENSAATESEVQLDGFSRGRFRIAPALLVAAACLALLAGVLWLGGDDQTTEAAQSISSGGKTPSQASQQGPELAVANVREVLDGLGMERVVVDYRSGTIHVGGPVPTQTQLDTVSAAVRAVAGDYDVDTTALVVLEPNAADSTTTAPAPAAPVAVGNGLLQSELDRIIAVTPLIFETGQADLTALHQRVLNNVVLVLQSQPTAVVTIAGFTDDEGTDEANRQVSLSRAENVKAYLVSQGIDPDSLRVEARGEDTASGSAGLAGLERRVEFNVEGATAAPVPAGPLRVALVAPSAMNDLAFTQSMVDSLNLMAEERGIEIAITDNTFVPEEAAAAVESYAEQGYDLVIAHGSQFGASLIEIAPRHPNTAFAWGTASDTFGLPNVYAYDAAAEEGGYVLGTVATLMSGNRITGVVGPIDVGDAAQYVRGFDAGAKAADPASNVLITFTGSFSDITLASEAAQAHIDAGAQVLTGSAQMVVGAIATADQQGVKWFGTQANQASLAPNSVVASQVYRWEVALRPILDDVAAGTLQGNRYSADLANGGLVIEYNPAVPVAPEILQRADEVTNAIISGQIDP
ncbi:MAG: BMP family ABC transporter substrate-binding protein, partial [Actinomycetota bacterium]